MSYQLDQRLELASTIPSTFYTESGVLSAEQRNIFATTWQLAGSVEKVREPGQFFTIEIGGEPLLIVRGNDGVVRGMSNVCRHRAGPVAKGEGQRPVLQCGYHGWTYGLDGQLKTTPEFEGVECFERSAISLPQFPIEEWHGLLFVNLDRAASPLAEFLQGLPGDMPQHDHSGFRLAARKDWEVGCNWKVYVDNYLEGYHIPIVHPGLFRELDYPNYRTETRKNYSIQFAPTRRADRIRTTAQDGEVRYFWVFPNLMLNVYPDNFSTNLIVPVGHDRCRTIFEWYFRDPDDAKTRSDLAETIELSDEIQLEDIDICQSVQRGLGSSTYSTGRYSPQRENGVHHFHKLYAELMGIPLK